MRCYGHDVFERHQFPGWNFKLRNAQGKRKATVRGSQGSEIHWMDELVAQTCLVPARSAVRNTSARQPLDPFPAVRRWGCWLALLVILFASLSASSATLTNLVSAETPAPLPEVGFSVVRVLGALILVVGLFLGGTWLARNWQRVVARQARPTELKVLEVKSLGGRQALWIVGYRQQRLLVASSPSGVNLLTELPEATGDEPAPGPTIDFAEAFRQVLGRRS